jgi:hypothetical protein
LAPRSAAGFFYLGEAQIAVQRYQEAIASFWQAASLRHNMPKLTIN